MFAGPDDLKDTFPLHLLLESSEGLLEGFIFTNVNYGHKCCNSLKIKHDTAIPRTRQEPLQTAISEIPTRASAAS